MKILLWTGGEVPDPEYGECDHREFAARHEIARQSGVLHLRYQVEDLVYIKEVEHAERSQKGPDPEEYPKWAVLGSEESEYRQGYGTGAEVAADPAPETERIGVGEDATVYIGVDEHRSRVMGQADEAGGASGVATDVGGLEIVVEGHQNR